MSRILLTFLFTFLALGTLEARLGETEEAIASRLGAGKPSNIERQPGANTVKFTKNGFEVEVVFHEGKSIWEIYHKIGHTNDFPEVDLENVLDAYKDDKRNWRFDRKDNRWESAGKPKYIAYRWPGHSDYFCVKDFAACEVLDKSPAGSKGL